MERKEYFVDFLVSVMKNSLNLAVVKWRMAKRIILFGREKRRNLQVLVSQQTDELVWQSLVGLL